MFVLISFFDILTMPFLAYEYGINEEKKKRKVRKNYEKSMLFFISNFIFNHY